MESLANIILLVLLTIHQINSMYHSLSYKDYVRFKLLNIFKDAQRNMKSNSSFMALITCQNSFCTGTFINTYWILTSGFCLDLGQNCSRATTSPFGRVIQYDIINTTIHPYLWYTLRETTFVPFVINDVALVKVAQPVTSFLKVDLNKPLPGATCQTYHWIVDQQGLILRNTKASIKFVKTEEILDMDALSKLRLDVNELGISMTDSEYPHLEDSGAPLVCNDQIVGLFSFQADNITYQFKGWTLIKKYLGWMQKTAGSNNEITTMKNVINLNKNLLIVNISDTIKSGCKVNFVTYVILLVLIVTNNS